MTVENVEVHLGRVYVAPDAHWPARTIGMARGREWRWRKWEMTGAPDGPKSTGRRLAVDVYRSAKESVEWLWPRLVVGGMVVYDDYGFQQCEGITRFVNEQRGYTDRVVIYNLNGHGVIVKTAQAAAAAT